MDAAAFFGLFAALLVGAMAFVLMRGRRPRAGLAGRVNAAGRDSDGARLRVVEGEMAGAVYPLPSGGLTIGREPGNDICVPGLLVSRRHARVFKINGQWMIEDADSTNGTWVNQRKVVRCALRPGDVVAVGPCQFVVEQAAQAWPAARQPGAQNDQRRDAPAWLEDEGSKRIPVLGDGLRIGRSGDNHLRPQHAVLSPYHARLWRRAGRWVLSDLRSGSGTWVNGKRINEQEVFDGDRIEFGNGSPYRFRCEPASSLAARGAGPAQADAAGAARSKSWPAPAADSRAGSEAGRARISPPRQEVGGSVSQRPGSQPGRTAGDQPAPSFISGQRLGAYALTQFIGSGGAAHVYKAISPHTGQPVAIKVLVNADPYLREKFEQEGRLGRKLVHPHIARVLDCSQANGVYFVVMEYVDGGSLRKQLAPGRAMEIERVGMVMRETSSALAYAHDNGIVHRDVKPENIMFSTQGGVKLVDFGIARFTQEVTFTSSGMILGTPYYMSPEQACGDPVDRRTDVYSLGVVMYEMLTGQVPFDGRPLSVAQKHIEEPPPLQPLQIAGVPARLQDVVLIALAKSPKDRYATASLLASAVQNAVR